MTGMGRLWPLRVESRRNLIELFAVGCANSPMGRGGERLHRWLFVPPGETSEMDARMSRETSNRVGAVLVGRRTFDIGVDLWEDTPFPVPSFVVTHEPHEPLPMKSAVFIFVTNGIESALGQAREAAGGKDIIVMGAELAQQYLKAGLVDEIMIQLVPVLMGAGTRLFDNIGGQIVELETSPALQSPTVTHLRFQLDKPTNL